MSSKPDGEDVTAAVQCQQKVVNGVRGMCPNAAAYRYTWPGRDESWICEHHSGKLKAVANAIGLHLQLVPLGKD